LTSDEPGFYRSLVSALGAGSKASLRDLRIGTPKKLFTFAQAPAAPTDWPGFALGPGGETFIMVRPVARPHGLGVIENWLALVEP